MECKRSAVHQGMLADVSQQTGLVAGWALENIRSGQGLGRCSGQSQSRRSSERSSSGHVSDPLAGRHAGQLGARLMLGQKTRLSNHPDFFHRSLRRRTTLNIAKSASAKTVALPHPPGLPPAVFASQRNQSLWPSQSEASLAL